MVSCGMAKIIKVDLGGIIARDDRFVPKRFASSILVIGLFYPNDGRNSLFPRSRELR